MHPLAVSSPAFASFPLEAHGLEWIQPPIALAHPFDNGSALALYPSLEQTSQLLGADGAAYRRIVGPLSTRWRDLVGEILQPPLHFPEKIGLLARFGLLAMQPAAFAAKQLFRTEAARALFAGLAAHSVLPLEAFGSAAFGWVLAAAAHAVGWPIPRGGSQKIANALSSYFRTLGGSVLANTRVTSLAEVLDSALLLCDITPRQLLQLSRDRFPAAFADKLSRYRYGPAAFKMDWALSAPIPWKSELCTQAATVHIGGTMAEIAASERSAWEGEAPAKPFVILVQPSLFDSARAPLGAHTAWVYCHVPNRSPIDMRDRIEQQIERFAPGFRDLVLARHIFNPADLERHNANLVGGDITGGAQNLSQLLWRPTRMLYRTPLRGVYLCSSSTPPGGGVHGMCGFHAAHWALRDSGASP